MNEMNEGGGVKRFHFYYTLILYVKKGILLFHFIFCIPAPTPLIFAHFVGAGIRKIQ